MNEFTKNLLAVMVSIVMGGSGILTVIFLYIFIRNGVFDYSFLFFVTSITFLITCLLAWKYPRIIKNFVFWF